MERVIDSRSRECRIINDENNSRDNLLKINSFVAKVFVKVVIFKYD